MTKKEEQKIESLQEKVNNFGEILCILYRDKLIKSLQKEGYNINKDDFVIERHISCENSPMCVKYKDLELPVGLYYIIKEWEHNHISISKTLKQDYIINALHNFGYISNKEFKENIKNDLYEQSMNQGYSDENYDSFGEFLSERD